MKQKAILVSFIAILAIAFALSTVIAHSGYYTSEDTSGYSNYTGDMVSQISVKINGITASETSPAVAGEVSNTVPVEVEFVANKDVTDVKIRVSIDGYKEDISATTPRFHIVEGSKYVKRFSIELPSTMDLSDLTEAASLVVEVSAKEEDTVEKTYSVEMQRDLYSLNILSIDTPNKVTAGSTFGLDVVLQNNGNNRLDNTYVQVSIPELDVERKVYFGDLAPHQEESYEDIRDAQNRVLYLTLPRNAAPGNYNLVVEAYNYDTSTSVKKRIVVESAGSQSSVVPSVTSKTIAVGEEAVFDVVLANPNDKMVIYTVTPDQSAGLVISIDQPVVAVSAGSSKTVTVRVKATDSAQEGTHVATVNVNSESGLERKVNFTVNVEKQDSQKPTNPITGSNATVILIVVLVIIFVVLLVVLIVLLTRKPAETEEFGETSYY